MPEQRTRPRHGQKLVIRRQSLVGKYKTFYEDYTHRVPFSKESLRDINYINGFKDVKVESFIQLPIIFENKGLIKKLFFFLSNLTRLFVPDLLKNKFKWVRFSKEIMLLSYSKK